MILFDVVRFNWCKRLWQLGHAYISAQNLNWWVTFILHSFIESPDVSFKRWSLNGLFSEWSKWLGLFLCQLNFFVDVNNLYICCILVRFISHFLERPLNFTTLLWNKNLPVRSWNNSMDFCALGMTTNESDSHQYHTPMPRWLGEDDKWIMNSCGQCVSTDCSTTFGRRPKQKHRLVQKAVSIVLFKKNMLIAFMLSRRYSLFQGWYATVLIESSMNREATSPVKKHTLKWITLNFLNIPSFLHM